MFGIVSGIKNTALNKKDAFIVLINFFYCKETDSKSGKYPNHLIIATCNKGYKGNQ